MSKSQSKTSAFRYYAALTLLVIMFLSIVGAMTAQAHDRATFYLLVGYIFAKQQPFLGVR